MAIIVFGAENFPKPECDIIHNVLLHGANKLFPQKENSNDSNKAGPNNSKENTNTSTHVAAVSDVHDIESLRALTISLNVTSSLR